MNVLIVEDERPAAEKLELLIKRYDSSIVVADRIDNISQTVKWLQNEANAVDLIFMDIQLADGLSLEIFERVEVLTPVIFITAYQEYAIEAFKVNSIDYLLKPVTYDALHKSLEKIKTLKANLPDAKSQLQIEELSQALAQFQKNYKTRFMVKVGEHIRSIKSEEILFLYADGRVVYIVTDAQKKYIIDYKLEDLEDLLDPNLFFRVNRSHILNINGIADVIVYSNSRLKIVPKFKFDSEIIVAREKVARLKYWFNGEE